MKKFLIFVLFGLMLSPAFASDTLNVSYRMIYPDSIPEGYFCLVVECGFSRKAKYELYINDYKSYAKINIASQKYKWTLLRLLRGKGNRCQYYAYILVKRDSTFSEFNYLPIEIYRKTFFGIFNKRVYTYIQYYEGYNYCVLANSLQNNKKTFFIPVWINRLSRCK